MKVGTGRDAELRQDLCELEQGKLDATHLHDPNNVTKSNEPGTRLIIHEV